MWILLFENKNSDSSSFILQKKRLNFKMWKDNQDINLGNY